MSRKFKKIVITGAPSSGKSSVIQHLSELTLPRVILIPECARLLLNAGYPTPDKLHQIHAFQKAILNLQDSLESSFELTPDRQISHMILDRGTPDGAGFWPQGIKDFFQTFHLDIDQELSLYDHVLFMELPPKEFYGGTDKARFHNYEQSVEAGKKLEEVWSRHPKFVKVPAQYTFEDKITRTVQFVREVLFAENLELAGPLRSQTRINNRTIAPRIPAQNLRFLNSKSPLAK